MTFQVIINMTTFLYFGQRSLKFSTLFREKRFLIYDYVYDLFLLF